MACSRLAFTFTFTTTLPLPLPLHVAALYLAIWRQRLHILTHVTIYNKGELVSVLNYFQRNENLMRSGGIPQHVRNLGSRQSK